MSNIDRLAYNRNGQLFMASNVSAKSVVAVSTTATGLILYNPSGSNQTLFILDAGWAWTTAPGAVHNIGIAVMAPNPTVPSSVTACGSGVKSGMGTGNAGNAVGICYDAATLAAAPVIQRISFGSAYGSAVGTSPHVLIDYIDGALAVAPGGAVCLAAVTTTAVGMGSFCWIEV